MPRTVTTYDSYEPPRLSEQRCRLEPLTALHAQHLFAPLSDPALYTFIPGEPPASVEALCERFTRLETRRSPDRTELWLNWAAKNEDGVYVGLVEATARADASVQLAYFVFSNHQRQGYGFEVVQIVLDHLASALALTTARALVDARNVASQRLLERLGFTRKRLIRNADSFKGAVSDEFEYERSLTP